MTTGSFFDGIFAHEKHYWFYLPIYLYSNFGGVREVAKKIDLGENEDHKLARLDKTLMLKAHSAFLSMLTFKLIWKCPASETTATCFRVSLKYHFKKRLLRNNC